MNVVFIDKERSEILGVGDTIVKCDVVDCINNTHCQCCAVKVELILNHDSQGVIYTECATYQSKIKEVGCEDRYTI